MVRYSHGKKDEHNFVTTIDGKRVKKYASDQARREFYTRLHYVTFPQDSPTHPDPNAEDPRLVTNISDVKQDPEAPNIDAMAKRALQDRRDGKTTTFPGVVLEPTVTVDPQSYSGTAFAINENAPGITVSTMAEFRASEAIALLTDDDLRKALMDEETPSDYPGENPHIYDPSGQQMEDFLSRLATIGIILIGFVLLGLYLHERSK